MAAIEISAHEADHLFDRLDRWYDGGGVTSTAPAPAAVPEVPVVEAVPVVQDVPVVLVEETATDDGVVIDLVTSEPEMAAAPLGARTRVRQFAAGLRARRASRTR